MTGSGVESHNYYVFCIGYEFSKRGFKDVLVIFVLKKRSNIAVLRYYVEVIWVEIIYSNYI